MKKGGAPARKAALTALLQVEESPETGSGEALDRAARQCRLDVRDFRLASAIVYGVLRRALWLDLQYQAFLRKPAAELSPGLRTLFRMAACQRFHLERIPAHAIVSDNVELARGTLRANAHEQKFINAVTRRIVELESPVEPPPNQRRSSLMRRYSCPEWLLGRLSVKFGAQLEELLQTAFLSEAPVTLRLNRLVIPSRAVLAELLQAQGVESDPGVLAPAALRLRDAASLTDLLASPLFDSGAFYLQDEASQIVAHLACPKPGMRILDLCSAPGGKATHLAELADGRALVIATDISDARLARVRENAARLKTPGLEIVPLEQLSPELAGHLDAAAPMQPDPAAAAAAVRAATPDESFDLVLVDAPCSGLGTVRRKPEIRYRVSADSLARLAQQQLRILTEASRFVRPGGRLLYSTCTVSDEENKEVVKAFLQTHPHYSLVETQSPHEEIRNLRSGDGLYRTWPQHLAVDGFEAAILQREG